MIDSKNSYLPAGQIRPFFQPILSLQSMSVVGHESLGREIVSGEVQSLGPFFHNPDIPEAIQIATDRKLRQMAIEKAVREEYGGLLFINLKPCWIYRAYRDTGMLPTLEMLKRHGLPADRVVVEITEESFSGKLKELLEIVDIYRKHGCLIAVDDVGSGFSSLDRIAMFRPDIIKMDLKILRKSVTHDGYRALLRSFSIIAEQMGGSLLVEGVENVGDLKNAMAAGARYVQGYLFSEARQEFQQEQEYAGLLNDQMARYGRESYASYLKLMDAEHRLKELAERTAAIAAEREPDHLAGELIHEVPDNALRVYLCRGDGIQVSCNFDRNEDGTWTRNEEYRGSNWLWRPYFIPTIIHMQKQRSGILSQAYADLTTTKPIQSYSCPVGPDLYLFVDLLIR